MLLGWRYNFNKRELEITEIDLRIMRMSGLSSEGLTWKIIHTIKPLLTKPIQDLAEGAPLQDKWPLRPEVSLQHCTWLPISLKYNQHHFWYVNDSLTKLNLTRRITALERSTRTASPVSFEESITKLALETATSPAKSSLLQLKRVEIRTQQYALPEPTAIPTSAAVRACSESVACKMR